MAQFELNIYGKNDEITKKFETDKVRWGVYLEAVKLSDELNGKSPVEQFGMINAIIKKVFPDLKDADIENADSDDVMATFKQLLAKGNSIGGKNTGTGTVKNAEGME